jgi:hypothetical protein
MTAMTSLRLDDGASRHDGVSHFVMDAAQRQRQFVIESRTC